MKNTARARYINGTKRQSSQVKTQTRKINGHKPVTVIFQTGDTGKQSFRVEFPESEFAAIQRVCDQERMPLEAFFTSAIGSRIAFLKTALENKIKAPANNGSPSPAPGHFDLCYELEDAARQSQALAYLFVETIFHQEDATPADHIQAGLVDLYSQTHARLDRAVEAVRTQTAAHQQSPEAAL